MCAIRGWPTGMSLLRGPLISRLAKLAIAIFARDPNGRRRRRAMRKDSTLPIHDLTASYRGTMIRAHAADKNAGRYDDDGRRGAARAVLPFAGLVGQSLSLSLVTW